MLIIGDIHGCYAELLALLDVAGVGDDEVVVSVGDLVDRGPEPGAVVDFFRGRPGAVALCGNHERKHVRGVLSYSQQVTAAQLGDGYADAVAWMATLPYHLETEAVRVVHWGLYPGVPLAAVPALLAPLVGPDADCLRARHAGQVAHALNHAGRIDDALAMHAALPDLPTTAPFARSRRANGLAYGLHRRGDVGAALIEARRAATFAGDAGHVRLRAMALLMIARVAGRSAEGQAAHARAGVIADALADDVLRQRWRAAARDVA